MSNINLHLPIINELILKPFSTKKRRPSWMSKLNFISIVPSSSIDIKCAAKIDQDGGEGCSHFKNDTIYDGETQYYWTGILEGKKIFVASLTVIELETPESTVEGELGDCFIESVVFLEEWADWDKAIQILSFLLVIKNILLGLNAKRIIAQDWIMEDFVMNTLLLMGFQKSDQDFLERDDDGYTLIFDVKQNFLNLNLL